MKKIMEKKTLKRVAGIMAIIVAAIVGTVVYKVRH